MIIDFESEIFTLVADAIRAEFPDAEVVGEFVHAPSVFPHISIVEADNYSDTVSMPLSKIPVAARLMYEVNVHSNKLVGRKQECKAITSIINSVMESIGCTRIFMNPISNLENATIYRIVARYTKLQSKGGI